MIGTFLTGFFLYPVVELLWRGRTHPSMAAAGGTAMCALRQIARVQKNRPLAVQALSGGLVITGIEYIFGFLFNQKHQIWDYRTFPMNCQGQICLPYSLAWCALSLPVLFVMKQKQQS